METKEDPRQELFEMIQALPEKPQFAMHWLIANLDTVEKMSNSGRLSEEERIKYKQQAIAQEDYMMLVLLLFEELRDEYGV